MSRTMASADLTLALELADAADEITMARFGADDLVVETKPDLTPVSEADRAVEQRLRTLVAERHPGDAIFGEEFGGDATGARRWIVDPIDGTKGYVRGMSVWATLLALQEQGEVTTAVVSAPAMGRRWWATKGGGAFTNREPLRPLRVSGVRALADVQLSFGGFEEWRESGRLQALLALASKCWRTRGFGDFWQYMLVAEGVAEICADPTVSEWDLAAPMLVVREAGGTFTDLRGVATAAGGSALASNGLVHNAALSILAS